MPLPRGMARRHDGDCAVTGQLASLREKTERFHKTVYDSTLPYWLLDCLTSQAAIIRHIGVVFRIANGDIYGWEGSNGCCQPTCTHVWGYEQTLLASLPRAREGHAEDRLQAPAAARRRRQQPHATSPRRPGPRASSRSRTATRAASSRPIARRLNHPDDSWFKAYWPHVKRAVEYLIARDAAGSGGEPDGILQDDQWNTYDEALHGVTSFISGYYLAALRAGEEWARRVGDAQAGARFRAIFEKGRANLAEAVLERRVLRAEARRLPEAPRRGRPRLHERPAHRPVVGPPARPGLPLASRAGAVGPPGGLPPQLEARPDRLEAHPAGLRRGRRQGADHLHVAQGRPAGHVMLYSDEVWTGIEYQVAAHMIYEGMIEEGFAIVKGARDRYDGVSRPPIPRNPWNEIECGGHYARAMSSWSILLALSGYEYDGPPGASASLPGSRPSISRPSSADPKGGEACSPDPRRPQPGERRLGGRRPARRHGDSTGREGAAHDAEGRREENSPGGKV